MGQRRQRRRTRRNILRSSLLFAALAFCLIWNACTTVPTWYVCPLPLRGALLFVSVLLCVCTAAGMSGWPFGMVFSSDSSAPEQSPQSRDRAVYFWFGTLCVAGLVTLIAQDVARTASYTRLMDAVHNRDERALRAELARGTPPDTVPFDQGKRDGALNEAVVLGDLGMVSALLDAGADIRTPDLSDGGPLTLAATSGDAEMVALLLARGAPVNDSPGNSQALRAAAMQDHAECVRLLLRAGASTRTILGQSLLEELPALDLAHSQSAKYLREAEKERSGK